LRVLVGPKDMNSPIQQAYIIKLPAHPYIATGKEMTDLEVLGAPGFLADLVPKPDNFTE